MSLMKKIKNKFMENKTTSYLNSKIWYRLLKVIFILVCLAVLIGFNFFVFTDIGIKNIDQNKTLIQCSYGDKVIFSPQSVNLNFSKSDFKNGIFDYKSFFLDYNDNKIKDIFKGCYASYSFSSPTLSSDIFAIQKIYEVWGNDRLLIKKETRTLLSSDEIKNLDEIVPRIEKSITNTDKANYLNFSIKLFDVKPVFTYSNFLKSFFIGNFIILLIIEALKRGFYYVVLGTLKPKK